VRHNIARKEIRDTIREEVTAVLGDLSKESIGDLLDRFGARTLARQALHHHGLPVARSLVATPEFAAWWAATH
jgi:hypothetical protein